MKQVTPAAVLRRVNYWKRRMMLRDWDLTVEFGPDTEDGSEAACLARPEYLAATLRFDLAQIKAEELDAYVVHELGHAVIWPLANCAHSMCGEDEAKLESVRVHEEGLATWMERVLVALHRG